MIPGFFYVKFYLYSSSDISGRDTVHPQARPPRSAPAYFRTEGLLALLYNDNSDKRNEASFHFNSLL